MDHDLHEGILNQSNTWPVGQIGNTEANEPKEILEY